MLEDIKNVIETTNSTNRNNYLKNGKFSKCTYERLIGNWSFILLELGYKPNSPRNIPKEAIIEEVLNFHEKYNGYFTAETLRKESKFGQRVVETYFGSFSNMLRELNLRVPDGKHITNEEILNDIVRLHNDFGVVSCLILDEHCIVSTATVINRFGSIENACNKANVPYDNKDSKFAKYCLKICNSILSEQAKTEYKFDWLVNPKTNRKLRVDAYYPKHNLVIEFDGTQHDCQTHYMTKKAFLDGQYRDSIKNKLIPLHNIKLLRIPYHYTINQIVDAVNNAINKD